MSGTFSIPILEGGAVSPETTGGAGLRPTNLDLPGLIIDFAGPTPPPGFLACPTAAGGAQVVSRITYAALFAAIGTTWGAGDGSTTFGIPWFPADYAAVQANANVGTDTVGQVISHQHSIGSQSLSYAAGAGVHASFPDSNGLTGLTGGAANLPAGVRVLKCVQY